MKTRNIKRKPEVKELLSLLERSRSASKKKSPQAAKQKKQQARFPDEVEQDMDSQVVQPIQSQDNDDPHDQVFDLKHWASSEDEVQSSVE